MTNIFSRCSCQKSSPVDGVCRECQGFSLVEVTLAMMVIAIGMLSVFSVFTAGLDQSQRSINDTKAAFFADEVFNGLLAASEADDVKDGISWFSIGLTNGCTNLIIVAEDTWENSETLDVIMDNKIHTNVYRLKGTDIENHSFRYSLGIDKKDRCIKSATLCVYPGEFGSTNDPHIFYMNLFNYQLQNP